MITGLGHFVDIAAKDKVDDILVAMPHRGRLNVLTEIFHKPYEKIFTEFADSSSKSADNLFLGFSGDVKYHLGTTFEKTYGQYNHTINLTIPPNPSHLETVNPVLYG